MAVPKYGYPLIVGIAGSTITDALRGSCLVARTHADGAIAATVDARHFVPRLSSMSVADGLISAAFDVSSGSLVVASRAVRSYVVTGPLVARRKGSTIELTPDPKGSYTIAAGGGADISISAGESRDLGFACRARIDLGPLQLGDWDLVPSGAPAFTGAGPDCYVGTGITATSGSRTFRFTDPPVVDRSLFTGMPAGLAARGAGVLIDESLVEVLLDTIQVGLNSRADMQGVTLRLVRMNGPGDLVVTGSGEYLFAGTPQPFRFNANAQVVLRGGQLVADYQLTAASHRGLPVLGGVPENRRRGSYPTRFPRNWASGDCGVVTVQAVGGSGGVIVLEATALPDQWDGSDVRPATDPAEPLLVFKQRPVPLRFANAAVAVGRRRAPLRIIGPWLDGVTGDAPVTTLDVKPEEVTVEPDSAGTLRLSFTGTGVARGTLVLPTNDGELRYRFEAASEEGSLAVLAIVRLRATTTRTKRGWMTAEASSAVAITHQRGGPVRYNVGAQGRGLEVRPAGIGAVFAGSPVDTRRIVFTGGNIPPGKYTGTVVVSTDTGSTHRVAVEVLVEALVLPSGRYWAEYFGGNSREIRALMPSIDADWARKYLTRVGRPTFPDDELYPPPRPCGAAHADWQVWRTPAGLAQAFESEGRVVATAEPDGAVIVAPTRGAGRLVMNDIDVEEEMSLRISRFAEVALAEVDLGQRPVDIAWGAEVLHVLDDEGTVRRFQVIGDGLTEAIDEEPIHATAMVCWGQRVVVARGPILDVRLSQAAGPMLPLWTADVGVDVQALAPTATGELAVAGGGQVALLTPGDEVEAGYHHDPAGSTRLLAAGRWLLGLGDGVAVFDLGGDGSLAAHVDVGQARSALQLDDVALVATDDAVVVFDLMVEPPRAAAHLTWDDVPADSLLRSARWSQSADHRVASVRNGSVAFHSLVRFEADPTAAALLAPEWPETLTGAPTG